MGSAEQLTLGGGGPGSARAVALRVLGVGRAAAVLLAREALVVLLCLTAWSLLPAALGLQCTTVMSDSMAPGIRAGDVVASRPVTGADLRSGSVRLGSVLLVDDPDHPGRLRLHRWVGEREDALVLRGDANHGADSSSVRPAAVRGVGVLRIPIAGLPVRWVRTAQPGPLVATRGAGLLVARVAFPPGSGGNGRGPRRQSTNARDRRRRVLVAGAAALVAVTGVSEHGEAWAAFSKTTTNGTESLKTSAFDCPARTGADFPTPSLYYSYMGYAGSTTSTSESDLSGGGSTGRLGAVAMRRSGTCGAGASPYVTLTTASTYVYQSLPAAGITAPAVFGVSAWFRTTTAGGKLAGFGNKGSGNSTTYDRHVYMGNDGRLTFGVQTDQGRYTCTSASAFADGQWHLVVATYSAGSFTMWTDDGQEACTGTAAGTITSYTGVRQFGNDTLSTTQWANASTASNFVGDLDETGVYAAELTRANARAVYAVGH